MTESWRRTHDWGLLTRAEIGAARDAGALPVLCVGAVEQHGDHLPVDMDIFTCHRVASLAAERCDTPHVLVLPPMPFGFSPHHLAWAGTVSLSLDTFFGMVRDVADSLRRTGFKRMLVVNGHVGNQAPLSSICNELVSHGVAVGQVNYFAPAQKDWAAILPGAMKAVGHACAYETAMQLALRPGEAARIGQRIDGLPPRLTPPHGEDAHALALAEAGLGWSALFGPEDVGYAGEPALATPALGETLLDLTVAGLAKLYADFAAAHLRTGAP